MTSIAVILPAAGQGSRFGALQPKQFLELAGRSVLEQTLEFFLGYHGVREVLVAAPASSVRRLRRAWSDRKAGPRVRIVTGGQTRQQSVARALRRVSPVCQWVAVHDVVRPLVTRRCLSTLIRAARRTGAAIPGLPSTDTLKEIDTRGYVHSTLDRRRIVLVQTPQVFRTSVLRAAMDRARKERFEGTDEAMLVERIGVPVKVVAGSRRNIKITVPADLQLADWLMQNPKALDA